MLNLGILMKRSFALLAAFLLLAQLPSARVVWSYQAADAITGRALLVSGKAIFASLNGKVYALDASSGTLVWSHDTGDRIVLEPQLFGQNSIAVATSGGRVSLISAENGGILMEKSLGGQPYSLASGAGKVYVALKDSLLAFDSSGAQAWSANFSAPIGQAAFSEDSLYFTSGGRLYRVDAESGEVRWAARADNSFLSRPVKSEGAVYIGASDGRLYSFDAKSGKLRWSYQTGGWVMSTPLVTDSSVYFGSNDGYFYSLSLAGLLRWRTYIGDGAWSQPQLYGSEVVFSANNGNVYGLDAENGSEKWSFSSNGRPGPLLLYNQKFLFGTSAGKVYALSPSPISSFKWPQPGEAVGNWKVSVEGSASAESGITKVEVRAAGGKWVAAEGGESWRAELDFEPLPLGGINVECRAFDRAGESESSDYSFITLRKMETAPLWKMYVSAPYEADPGKNFTLSAKDERGVDLGGITVMLDGKEYRGDSPMQLKLERAGVSEVSVQKSGYESVSFTINGKGGITLLLLGGGIALVALALAYFFFIRKMLKRKK